MRLSLAVIKILFQVGGWVDGWVGGGWEEKWRIKLTSAKVGVKVKAENGNIQTTLLILQLYSGWVTYLIWWYWCSLLVWMGGFGEMETKTNFSQS